MSFLTIDNAIVLAFGLLGLLAIRFLMRGAAPLDRQWRRALIACPELGRKADCVLEQDVRSGRWVDVKRCSLFPEGAPITCDKACLKLLAHVAPRPRARAG